MLGGPANEPSEKQDSGSHSVHAHCFPGSCDQTLITVSCIVTQLTRESFGIYRLRGSCWYVYERIRLNLINPKVLKIEIGLCLFYGFYGERMQLVYEVILLNKILRNHLLSENMQ